MAKKIPSEEHSPFYLTGASVDMPDDGMDEDSFQVSAEFYIPQNAIGLRERINTFCKI